MRVRRRFVTSRAKPIPQGTCSRMPSAIIAWAVRVRAGVSLRAVGAWSEVSNCASLMSGGWQLQAFARKRSARGSFPPRRGEKPPTKPFLPTGSQFICNAGNLCQDLSPMSWVYLPVFARLAHLRMLAPFRVGSFMA